MTKWLIAASIIVLLLGSLPAQATTGDTTCVAQIREATSSDVLLRERNPLLGAPEDANNAPGPGSLRAVVRPDSLRHSFIFIDDTATGATRRLCSGYMPRFSPDGRWIACARWLSTTRFHVLALVDARTGRAHMLDRVGHIGDYAWSPDSKRLAYTSSQSDTTWRHDVGWIDVNRKLPHVLVSDAEPYVYYIDCEWAADSRRFLVNRHREYDHDDSVAHDLWLCDIDDSPCRLTHTPDHHEDFPGWIDDRRIRYVAEEGWDAVAGLASRRVIELARVPAVRRRK